MQFNFRWKIGIGVITLLIFFGAAYLSLTTPLGPASPLMPPRPPMRRILDAPFLMGEAILAAEKHGYIGANDLEKLDFSSGDMEHGWSPQFISNSQPMPPFNLTKDAAAALSEGVQQLQQPPPRELSPIINLRRHNDQEGGTTDTLFLVLPDVKSEACASLFKITDLPLKLAPNNQTIIKDGIDDPGLPYEMACVRRNDGKIYLFVKIISRLQARGDAKWHMKH